MDASDDKIGLFSFGVFIKFSDTTDPSKYAIFPDREAFINAVTGLIMCSIIVTLLGSIWLRKRLLDKAIKLDKLAETPSDFSLIGYCPSFSDDCKYTKEHIENEVKEHFSSYFGIKEIEYVNVSYDISDFY